MAVAPFIPELWEKELLTSKAKRARVAQPGIINRDYEGQIRSQGDTVNINSLGALTVEDHIRNEDAPDPEVLSTTAQKLTITEDKIVSFYIDDADRLQVAGDLENPAAAEAARQMSRVQDAFLIGTMLAGAGVSLDSAELASAGDAYDYLVDVATALDEAEEADEVGRFALITPAFRGLIRKDARFVGSGAAEADARLRNGVVGEAAGFTLVLTPSVTVAGQAHVIAGHGSATTLAEQMVKTEKLRSEKRVADLVRSRHLYGASVIRPLALAAGEVTVGAGDDGTED